MFKMVDRCFGQIKFKPSGKSPLKCLRAASDINWGSSDEMQRKRSLVLEATAGTSTPCAHGTGM